MSRYGAFEIHTSAGASCTLRVRVDRGTFGDGPPPELRGTAGTDGSLIWSYAAPPAPEGRGQHVVICAYTRGSAQADAEFAVPAKKIDPRGFTVRLQPVDPTQGLSGLTTRLDPSLVPARDVIVSRVAADLAGEWSRATRGLGALRITSSSADIVINLIPGRGQSVNQHSSDGTQRVLLFTVDDLGQPVSPEHAVEIALHELGHIWCCFGEGAGPDEHWLEKIPDPELVGVNRFGLMTQPVTCRRAGTSEICANRFSGRELRTMGFTEIPAPLPDACPIEFAALSARIAALDASLDPSAKAIEARNLVLDGIVAQMQAIEAQYRSGSAPPEVRAAYRALADRYDALYAEVHAAIDAHNSNIQTRNEIAGRRNALPC